MLKNHYCRIGFYDNQGSKYSPGTERKIREHQSIIEENARRLFKYAELIASYQLIVDDLKLEHPTLSEAQKEKQNYYTSRILHMRQYLLDNEIESTIELSFRAIESLHNEDDFRDEKSQNFNFQTFS